MEIYLRDSVPPALELANVKTALSRRRLMLLLAASASASAVLVTKMVRAQGDIWREYRRDDWGFRMEMPGEPQVVVDDEPGNKGATISVTYDEAEF